MDKYFDRSGMAIDNAKIKCIDSVKGTGEYIYRVTCNKCNGRGERNHFYKSRCIACNATGYSPGHYPYLLHPDCTVSHIPRSCSQDLSRSGSRASTCCSIKDFRVQPLVSEPPRTGGRHHAARRREQFFEQPEVDVITQISIK
nr:hypothetical protein [Escherichia coli]